LTMNDDDPSPPGIGGTVEPETTNGPDASNGEAQADA
jgi:hypothetical protein